MSSQRVERVAGEVRAVIGEALARDELKDPRIRGAGLITVTHVRVSGDLQHASGFFRQAIARRLRMKVALDVTFEVDKVFDQAAHVEQLLREIAPPPATAASDKTDDADETAAPDDVDAPDETAAPDDVDDKE